MPPHLRADNTVQQHVSDHLRNFVATKPRRYLGWYAKPLSGLWHQPLYVDEKDGILKRTDRLPEAGGAPPCPPQPATTAG